MFSDLPQWQVGEKTGKKFRSWSEDASISASMNEQKDDKEPLERLFYPTSQYLPLFFIHPILLKTHYIYLKENR